MKRAWITGLRAEMAGIVRKHPTLLFIFLVATGSLRIIATYHVFNHTNDEPTHVACGMEWLARGEYRLEPQHPPLARVAAALGPYLVGRRLEDRPTWDEESVAVLAGDKHYDRNLTLARLGILPFFWIASLAVYLWARHDFGEPGAAASVFLFTCLPPVLAHAGLATTDMALTAFLGLAFIAAIRWLENPRWSSALALGVASGLALLSKFSALVFFPSALLASLIGYLAAVRPSLSQVTDRARRCLPTFSLALAACFLVIWAGYRFSFGKVYFADLRLPAPEFYAGIRQLIDHDRAGHPAYLLGQRNHSGWWYYYPVVLAFKTPLAFLLLLFIGIASSFTRQRRRLAATWVPLAFSLGVLLFALTSRINIGIRHVLPVYTGFSIVAAMGVLWLWDLSRASRWAG